MLYILTLMLRHQSVGVLPLLFGDQHTVLYLPTPCPLPIAPHDFSQGAHLVEAGYATAKAFLEELRVDCPGIYGHPHFHAAAHVPPTAVPVEEASAADAVTAARS